MSAAVDTPISDDGVEECVGDGGTSLLDNIDSEAIVGEYEIGCHS